MRIAHVQTGEQLRDFMTTPTDGLVEFMRTLSGDLLVLGAGGKMGPDLLETIVRADRSAGVSRNLIAASRFSDPAARARLAELGVEVRAGDLVERSFLEGLPDARHVIYMAGVKFGTSEDWRQAFHLNCILPYLVGERFRDARILVFSSGNPYPGTRPEQGGCKESDELCPQGVYGWTIAARECAFATTALASPSQKLCFFRLAYAQHLGYGVLVDLAKMVWAGEPVSLQMPAVNLVSQRDAVDAAVRALAHCTNPAFVLNCSGPIARVRHIVEGMAALMGREPNVAGPEAETASLANDELCVATFGAYRDGVEEMMEAAARWVMRGGESWGKPTMFGRAPGTY